MVRYSRDHAEGDDSDAAILQSDLSPASLAGQWHVLKYDWQKRQENIPRSLQVDINPFRGRTTEISWKTVGMKTWHMLRWPWEVEAGSGLVLRQRTKAKRRAPATTDKQQPLRPAPEPFPFPR